MYDSHSPWYIYWFKHPLLQTIHLYRNWIKNHSTTNENIEKLHHADKQLKQMEVAVRSRQSDPRSLYQWFSELFLLQKQLLDTDENEFSPQLLQITTRKKESSCRDSSHFYNEKEKPVRSTQPISEPRVPIGKHKLPPLPYDYAALEPYIDEKTMRLHHDEHHLSYVNGLNKAEKMMEKARQTGNYELLKHWEREAAFHGAGHYLHTLFWETMSPQGGGEPSSLLLNQIKRDFGSFDAFQMHFSNAAEKVEGSGWAILVWAPRSHRLEILQAEKHQNLSQWDVIPLLPLDVWEHAYYLKYPNRRKEYIEAWWDVVYWPEVEKRWVTARQVIWKPY
ncbi:superoxide dismutase [Hazenella coriacea]|uniref:superoxide dismutase n=1 Tax=Hazenella coriacea TaxID=1179467 RepID=A0A4R3L5I8_9BACL|nr:superoxide dismutase [Hazenella coriacea]TCS92406.1 superoxide dismutase [Hazenella coriacea]